MVYAPPGQTFAVLAITLRLIEAAACSPLLLVGLSLVALEVPQKTTFAIVRREGNKMLPTQCTFCLIVQTVVYTAFSVGAAVGPVVGGVLFQVCLL